MTNRTRTDYIAVHCSATKPDRDIGEAEIRSWHQARGWQDIGYNVVIRRSGAIEVGRPLDEKGAHVAGFNDLSVGVCLIGGISPAGLPENNFTDAQFDSLELTIKFLHGIWPQAVVRGHRDFPDVRKDCPCFDVQDFLLKRGL